MNMHSPPQATTTRSPALGSAPAIPDSPPPPRMPPATLRIRVKTSPWLRRVLPTRLVVARAVHRGQRIWEDSQLAREEALAMMEAIVAGTTRADELTELARRQLIEREAANAIFWQPWVTPGIDTGSREQLREALSQPRGVLLSTCHVGPYAGATSIVRSLGHVPYSVAGPWYFEPPSHDLWGRRLAHWRKSQGTRLIRSTGSFATLLALLEGGETVYLFFDLPGSHRTRFLGRPTMLADGSARLAMQSDALVLPVHSHRVGHRSRFDVGAPLDPRRFAGADELHDALAAIHERCMLEHPEEMEDPRGFGWHATSAEWSRPKRPDRPE